MKKMMKCFMVMVVSLFMIAVFATGNSVYAKGKAKKIKINSFPDKYVREAVRKHDKNENGYLSEKELKKITIMDLESDSEPINLKGIRRLKYLKHFTISNCCSKKVVNVKEIYKLSNLESLSLDSCHFNKKIKLNLKSLVNLKHLRLGTGKVKEIDITNNKKLETLDISECIKKIDLTKNKNLKELVICGNKNLKKVNLKKNKKLEKLMMYNIESKYSLRYNKQLKELRVEHAKTPNITKNKELRKLNYFYPEDEKIVIGKGNVMLKKIDICLDENTELKFTINGCKKIKKLDLWGFGTLKELNIANCGKIKEFCLSNCNVEKISLGQPQNVQLYYVNLLGKYYKDNKISIS